MSVISIAAAKKSFSALVKRAAEGERIEIGAYGRPQVAMVAAANHRDGLKFGTLKGLVVPDDFDAPLPEHILDEFDCGAA